MDCVIEKVMLKTFLIIDCFLTCILYAKFPRNTLIFHYMTKKIINLSLSIFLIFSMISCENKNQAKNGDNAEIKNIIFLIGDGMGLSTVYAAMTISDHPLNIERCTSYGFIKTYSLDNYITDSAAGGTAMASGKKTNNGVICQDPQGNKYKSILEIAEENGRATGLVATSAITHATPASFIAHESDRDNYEAIARDFLDTDIDVFIGGGYDHFAKRSDNLNLIDSLLKRGYEVDTSLSMIQNSSAIKLAGFTAPVNNPYRLNGRGDMLPVSTEKAIQILSKNRKGFFLMVEGSQIDFAAHNKDAESLVDETLDFDNAVGVALDFAEKDGHTLVLVTADHETGGVNIVGGDIVSRTTKLYFSSYGHTAVMVPVYAYGPGSGKFAGIYDNTAIFHKLLSLSGFRKRI